MSDQPDYLEHYGVPGMKWGKKKAAERKARNDTIDSARSKQSERHAELSKLKMQRLQATSAKGKKHLDRKIEDKNFEIANSSDAHVARQLKTGEKWMKGAKVAGMMGMAVVGLGSAAAILDSAITSGPGTYTKSEGASRSLVVGSNTNHTILPGYTIVGGKVIQNYVTDHEAHGD